MFLKSDHKIVKVESVTDQSIRSSLIAGLARLFSSELSSPPVRLSLEISTWVRILNFWSKIENTIKRRKITSFRTQEMRIY